MLNKNFEWTYAIRPLVLKKNKKGMKILIQSMWTWMNTETALWVAQYTVTLFEVVLIWCDDFSLLFLFRKCLNSGFEILYLILLDLIWFCFWSCLLYNYWVWWILIWRYFLNENLRWWLMVKTCKLLRRIVWFFTTYSGFSRKYRQFYHRHWY